MRHIKFLAFALCASLFLAGCQETPDRVKENMETYGDNPQVAATEITYCSIDDLREAKITGMGSGNLVLPEDVDFSAIEGIDVLHMKIEDGFLNDKNIEKYTSMFHMDKEKFAEGEAPGYGRRVYYDGGEGDDYMDIWENGGMAYMAGQAAGSGTSTVEAEYRLDQDDISGVSIDFPSGPVGLPKLCQEIEEWLDEGMPIDGVSHKISDVAVRKQEGSGKETLSMCAEYEYKGIRFNYHASPIFGEDILEGNNTDLITTYLMTEMDFENPILPSFFTRNESFSIESSEPVTQVVDFESAVRIVEKTMSGFGSFYIQEILPLYMPYTVEHCKMPGKKMEARPVYAFLTKGEEEGEPDRGIMKLGRYGHFFLVDMVTGELTTDLELERKG